MNKINAKIWGRNFVLPVIIKKFKGKQITETQETAKEKLPECIDAINDAQEEIEKYILENDLAITGKTEIDNIFKYVIPKSISVPKMKNRTIALMCNYKFDKEHGLAIVIESEKIKDIGPQDIVL